VPNQYIVVLHETTSLEERDAHVSLLKAQIGDSPAAEVTGVFGILDLVGYFARLTPALLKEILEHPQVKYVEQDQVMSITSAVEAEDEAPLAVITQVGATWGLDRIDQRDLPLNQQFIYDSRAGTGVDVFIVDTGLLITHTQFGGRASAVFNAITNEANNDLNGHGTHVGGTVAGTTYGVAKGATLKAVKVLSGSGSGTTAGVISGVNYVTNNKVASRRSVANMSLGGGASATLDSAVANSVTAGVIFAVAAGNDNANACNSSPARVTSAITVGASASNDARSTFSNIGTCVDVFAPGTSITSAWIGSASATNTISGTSMASPHVAGVAALHASVDPALPPTSYQSYIIQTATANKITNVGTGSPNRLLYSPY
jgi:serine protease